MISKLQGVAGAEQLQASAPVADSPKSPSAGAATSDPERFKRALGSLGREIDKGEKLVQRALHGGGHLGAADLIALQAGIYRYSEAVDLAAKLVDRAGNAVRTTLQSSGS